MNQIDIFLPMIPPTATQQEKKINFKTKRVYSDHRAADARAKLRAYLAKYIPEEPLAGPINMTVIWGFPAKGKHKNGDWHTNKPDLDNLQKALQDVMTELGYFSDDCRISQLLISKVYTYHPGVSILANEMYGNAYDASDQCQKLRQIREDEIDLNPTQKLIHCRDCKYSSPNQVYGCRINSFAGDIDKRMYADDFCSMAKRREK